MRSLHVRVRGVKDTGGSRDTRTIDAQTILNAASARARMLRVSLGVM